MPVEVKGALAVRQALAVYAPDLAVELYDELGKALKPIASEARGFVKKPSGLSSWFKHTNGKFPQADMSEITRGIKANVNPSKPNKRGFVSLARIENASASGAIMETAGRKNPDGRSPVMYRNLKQYGGVYGTEGRRGGKDRSRRDYKSNNPFAGYQFVHGMKSVGPLVSIGRGRKNRGRLIFKAWKKDQGKTVAATMKAIENANVNFHKLVKRGA